MSKRRFISYRSTLMQCMVLSLLQLNCCQCSTEGVPDELCINPLAANAQAHLRLVGFDSPSVGYLEVCRGGEWRSVTVTKGNWGRKDAAVVCKELGYLDTVAFSHIGYNLSPTSTWLHYNDIECTGIERKLSECVGSFQLRNNRNTQDMEQVFVLCDKDPSLGAVRVIGVSPKSSEGLLEIYHPHRSYKWSTVCTEDWTDTDAAIACKQMGFLSGISKSYSFDNSARVLPRKRYNHFLCNGTERTLLQCNHHGPYPYKCYTEKYAGVVCQGNDSQQSTLYISLTLMVTGLALFLATMCAIILHCTMKKLKKKTHSVYHSHDESYTLQYPDIADYIPPPTYEETTQTSEALQLEEPQSEEPDTHLLLTEDLNEENGANVECNGVNITSQETPQEQTGTQC